MAGGQVITIIALCMVLVPSWLWAAIIIDAITTDEGMNATNISVSHTAASDANLALACVTERDTALTMGSGPSVTYDGNTMTLVSGATQTQASRLKSSLFYYVGPPSGTKTVAYSRSTNANRYIMTVMTLKGAATSGTFNTAATFGSDAATNINIDTLASDVGEFAVMCGLQSTNAPVVSPDATATVSTEQVEVDHTDGTGLTHFVYTEAGASSSINMHVDSDTSTYTSAVAVSIRSSINNLGSLLRRRIQ